MPGADAASPAGEAAWCAEHHAHRVITRWRRPAVTAASSPARTSPPFRDIPDRATHNSKTVPNALDSLTLRGQAEKVVENTGGGGTPRGKGAMCPGAFRTDGATPSRCQSVNSPPEVERIAPLQGASWSGSGGPTSNPNGVGSVEKKTVRRIPARRGPRLPATTDAGSAARQFSRRRERSEAIQPPPGAQRGNSAAVH
jgi:hypothetical protein